jgi:hypothetical protein
MESHPFQTSERSVENHSIGFRDAISRYIRKSDAWGNGAYASKENFLQAV